MVEARVDPSLLAPPNKGVLNPLWAFLLIIAAVHSHLLRDASKAVAIKNFQSLYLQTSTKNLHNLVFGGGGFKGIAFVEVLKGLVDFSRDRWFAMVRKVKTVSGVSVGAITAAAVAVGATPWQIEDQVFRTDYKAISQWGGMESFNRMAILNPKGLVQTVKRLLKRFAGDENITLREVHRRYGKTLRIYVANLSKQRLECIDHRSHPKTKVWFAVKVSCSLPPYFPRVKWSGDIYSDGGIFRHSPGIGDRAFSPKDSLFLYLQEPICTDPNMIDYLMLLKASLQNSQTILIQELYPEYAPVTITTKATVSTLALLTGDLTESQKRAFKKDGRRALRDFLRLPTAAMIFGHNVAKVVHERAGVEDDRCVPWAAMEPALLREALL